MDELSLMDSWALRLRAEQQGVQLEASASGDVDEAKLVSLALDAWTGESGARVVAKFTEQLLAPADSWQWQAWDAARSQATFASTAELLLITMADVWRRLVFARDRQPYEVSRPIYPTYDLIFFPFSFWLLW